MSVRSWRALAIAIALCCASYALVNYRQLVSAILYRMAANDPRSAVINAAWFGVQLAWLATALLLLPRRAAGVFLGLLFVSAAVNIGYADILKTTLDTSSVLWLSEEMREAGAAAAEFAPALLRALAKALAAVVLLYFARRYLIQGIEVRKPAPAALASLLVLALTAGLGPMVNYFHGSRGAEFNLYGMAWVAIKHEYPARAAVAARPDEAPKARKIVWLVDESVAYAHFRELEPKIVTGIPAGMHYADFGPATSFANCSAQSNAALRWGVPVSRIAPSTDLRTTPTIWSYARAAGYHTTLIDGQVKGAPQDMLWKPELALIDNFVPALNGIDTDREVAGQVNRLLNSDRNEFVYVVLRGSHYQYSSNYPKNALPPGSSLVDSYHESITYSKTGFFETLFKKLADKDIAVFYTSDHGQVVKPGVLPHCSNNPTAVEFTVPLLMFLPDKVDWAARLVPAPGAHTHAQIFPTTLWLMGYSRDFAEHDFDNMLDKPPRAVVEFGKKLVPTEEGDSIEVRVTAPTRTVRGS